MKFVNPKNPLRRQAAAESSAQPAPTAAPAASGNGARTTPRGIPTPLLNKFASNKQEQNFDEGGNYNPRAFGGNDTHGGVRKAVASATNRMYDGQGNLNAYDNKDAMQQLAYLFGTVSKQSPLAGLTRQASHAEKEERRKVLAAALNDPEGFRLVGQELALPIKAIIDYEGWARKVYRQRPLAQGELFRLAKDIRATAYAVGQDGQTITSQAFGQYILPGEFKITSNPMIDIMDILQMNFDALDRLQDTARQEIELEEDRAGLRLLDRAATAVNTLTSFSTMGVAALEAVRYQVERHRLVVDKFLINRAEVSDIQNVMSTQVDPVTQRELNMAGYIGSFLGAHIVTCAGTQVEEVVPAGTFYAVTAPEYLGEMGIRAELFAEPVNGMAMGKTTKGWLMCEVLGFAVGNARSVAKAVKP